MLTHQENDHAILSSKYVKYKFWPSGGGKFVHPAIRGPKLDASKIKN